MFVRHGRKSRRLLVRPERMKKLIELQQRLNEPSMQARMSSPKAKKVRLQYGAKRPPERAFEFLLDD